MSQTASRSSLGGVGAVDPSAPGNIIRAALAFESFLTVAGASYFILFPRHYLVHTMGAAPAQVTTTALQATQQFGAVNVLLGGTVALFIPNHKLAIQARQPLYSVLLLFELLYSILLVWQATMMEGGMLAESWLTGAEQFVPFVVWRIFVLRYKPEWFGRYQEGRKVE